MTKYEQKYEHSVEERDADWKVDIVVLLGCAQQNKASVCVCVWCGSVCVRQRKHMRKGSTDN